MRMLGLFDALLGIFAALIDIGNGEPVGVIAYILMIMSMVLFTWGLVRKD